MRIAAVLAAQRPSVGETQRHETQGNGDKLAEQLCAIP